MTRNVRQHLDPGDAQNPLIPQHLQREDFGRRVKSLMIAKGWNQSELARRSDLLRHSVSTYVTGKAFPTDENLKKLAGALGVKPSDLLPNTLEAAIESDSSGFEMKVSNADDSLAWLRVNRLVAVETGAKVLTLLNEDAALRRRAKGGA